MRTWIPVVATLALSVSGSWLVSAQGKAPMTFFITSEGPGKGADIGGLTGADKYCQTLAASAGAGSRQWHAYLSTTGEGGAKAVNARDRIGAGPWHNAKGELVAQNLSDLHGEAKAFTKQTALTEKGEVVNGRGDTPNRHDILTGSKADGTVADGDAAKATCGNWTNSGTEGSAMVGHHDRQGGGQAPTSWNASHLSRGCSQENLRATGGDGLFYCFATK